MLFPQIIFIYQHMPTFYDSIIPSVLYEYKVKWCWLMLTYQLDGNGFISLHTNLGFSICQFPSYFL